MTGYTVHTGASKKFVSGWDRVFGSETDASESKGTKASKTKPAAAKKKKSKKK